MHERRTEKRKMRNAKIVSVLLASLVMLAACGANDKNGDVVTAAGAAPTASAAVTSAVSASGTSACTVTDAAPADTTGTSAIPDGAEKAARAYYKNTVYEVVSLDVKSATADKVVFTVKAKRGGELLEQPRSIELTLTGGIWTVTGEGY